MTPPNPEGTGRKRFVWVIEVNGGKYWEPTLPVFLFKREAYTEAREWRGLKGRPMRFRVKKYERNP